MLSASKSPAAWPFSPQSKVHIGAREPARGADAAARLGVEWLQLDVTDEMSVQNASAELSKREGRLDILINNAGISGIRKAAAELTGEDAEAVFATNVIGPIRVMNAFIPLLQSSPHPVIVNVSSGLGSFAVTSDPQRFESQVRMPLYCASKSALTMLTIAARRRSKREPTPSSTLPRCRQRGRPAYSSTVTARCPGNRARAAKRGTRR